MQREDLEKFGTKYGNNKGKVMMVIKDPYLFKSIGAEFISMISEMLKYLFYKPSISDMDFWMNPNTNPITDK